LFVAFSASFYVTLKFWRAPAHHSKGSGHHNDQRISDFDQNGRITGAQAQLLEMSGNIDFTKTSLSRITGPG